MRLAALHRLGVARRPKARKRDACATRQAGLKLRRFAAVYDGPGDGFIQTTDGYRSPETILEELRRLQRPIALGSMLLGS